MILIFLEASQPLTKTFSLDSDGQLVKGSYPFVSLFTSHEESITDLKDMVKVIDRHASQGHCLLKGKIKRPLVNESRAGSTSTDEPTDWLCLDFDGAVKLRDADEFLKTIDILRDVDYVLQYSASHGIDKTKHFSAHVFMRLSKPQMPSYIKAWLRQLNLDTPMLAKGLSLTATGMALRWPLDITTCQNDKLIYVAPPILGKGIRKPVGERTHFVRGKHRSVDFSRVSVNAESIAKKTIEAISRLREQAGLPAHSLRTKVDKRLGIEIMHKPGKATVTGVKENGKGFVQLNLNGGDSWGYYHPAGKPEIIYNFKGEPAYKAEDLIPEYYAQVIGKRDSAPDPHSDDENSTTYYLAFLDPRSDSYFRGTYDEASGAISLEPTNSVRKINDFLAMHGQPKPDAIPEWQYTFAFDDPRSIDIDKRFINRYQPSQYMAIKPEKLSRAKPTLPPGIDALLHHVMPSDEAVERFLNWLAVIYQKRIKPGTAWVWTGTQGTGKGLLFGRVLRPIFGERYCKEIDLNQLDENFNGFLEESVLIMIDEAGRDAVRNEEKVLGRLKHYITEPDVSIRKMHTNHYTARNYTSFIIASNEQSPLFIAYNDRRINVAPHQPEQIKPPTDKQLAQLDAELEPFAIYLASREADEALARKPLLNKARAEMMERTQKTADRIAEELLKGNFEYFLDSYTPPMEFHPSSQKHELARDYEKALRSLAERMLVDPNVKVWREQIRSIFEHLIGAMPMGVSKFGQFLGHHGIHYERMHHPEKGASHQGVLVRFKFNEKDVRAFLKDPVLKQIERDKVTPITKGKKNG